MNVAISPVSLEGGRRILSSWLLLVLLDEPAKARCNQPAKHVEILRDWPSDVGSIPTVSTNFLRIWNFFRVLLQLLCDRFWHLEWKKCQLPYVSDPIVFTFILTTAVSRDTCTWIERIRARNFGLTQLSRSSKTPATAEKNYAILSELQEKTWRH